MLKLTNELEKIFSSMSEILVIQELLYDENNRPYDYKLLYANESALMFFKTFSKLDNFIGKNITEIFNKKQLDYIDIIKNVVEKKETYKFQSEFLNRHYVTSFIPFDENKFITISTEITDKYNSFKIAQDIINLIPTGFIILEYKEPDKLFLVDANPSASQKVKFNLNDYKGKEFLEIFPNAIESGIYYKYLNVIKNNEILVIDDFYYNDENLDDYFKVVSFPLPDNKLAIAFENISELKKTYEKLKVEQEFNSNLLNNIPNLVILTDLEGNITYINHKSSDEFGIPDSSKIIGMNVISFLHDSDKERALKNLKETDINQKYSNIYMIKMPNNEIRYVEIIRSTYYQNNIPKGYIYIVNNITSRKKYEQEIIAARETYFNILNSINDGIFITDLNGVILDVNEGVTKMYGYTRKELLGATPFDFASKDLNNVEELEKIITKTIENGEPSRFLYWGQRKNGEVFPKDVIVNKGKYVGMDVLITVSRDITEVKEFEKELIKAKEKAEENERLKTAFLQNMSHEIRTPLNGILGFSKLLENEHLTKEELKEYTALIQKSGKRLLETINNILDISKIETRQVQIVNKHFSLNELLEDLYSIFENDAIEKNLNLKQNINPSQDIILYSDELKLNQILTNLISNAIKFTSKGKVEYGYTLKDNVIEFFVRDTGIGIDESKFEKIFDRFAQVDPTLTRGYEGSGLGLAICKSLVELLNGKIWLQSKVGEGTIFYFIIPINDNTQIIKTNVNDKINTYKILIAEDDFISQLYLKKLLESMNYQVLIANNGEEAIDIIRKNDDIKLIFMDIKMPVLDGVEAFKIIKSINKDVRIIAQTAYAFVQEKDLLLEIGFDDYISKPLNEELVRKIVIDFFNSN